MKYTQITTYDVNNGPGFRVTLWVSGCSIRCPGCHNKELWNKNVGQKFNMFTIKRLLVLCKSPHISGITICGGEPLDSFNKIYNITKFLTIFKHYFKNQNKTIWLYTGYKLSESQKSKLFRIVDVIVDGPYIDSLRDTSLAFRGSSNQIISYKNIDFYE